MSMKSIEEKLPPGKFFRIHKSYIYRVSHITAIRRNSVFLGELELPLSDLYKEDLMRRNRTGKSNDPSFGRGILTTRLNIRTNVNNARTSFTVTNENYEKFV